MKRTPGARKGNRNALKHGLYSGERIAMRLRVHMAIAEAKRAVAMVRMVTAMMDAETRRLRYAARDNAGSGSGSGSSDGATYVTAAYPVFEKALSTAVITVAA